MPHLYRMNLPRVMRQRLVKLFLTFFTRGKDLKKKGIPVMAGN